MLKNHFNIILIFILLILSSCVKKKTKELPVLGCTNIDASNFSIEAEQDNGSCVYPAIIYNPSFEINTWEGWGLYNGVGYSSMKVCNNLEGIMPTDGQNYLKLLPTVDKYMGTQMFTQVAPTKYYKGFYFDYSYKGIGNQDSLLEARIAVVNSNVNNENRWVKIISENPIKSGGFPFIWVEKKDEYLELNYSEVNGTLFVSASVTKGTFTFCIDNIRLVSR